jgi:hypothetical protein
MRKRARTDLCGGRSAMVVPTATLEIGIIQMLFPPYFRDAVQKDTNILIGGFAA